MLLCLKDSLFFLGKRFPKSLLSSFHLSCMSRLYAKVNSFRGWYGEPRSLNRLSASIPSMLKFEEELISNTLVNGSLSIAHQCMVLSFYFSRLSEIK